MLGRLRRLPAAQYVGNRNRRKKGQNKGQKKANEKISKSRQWFWIKI